MSGPLACKDWYYGAIKRHDCDEMLNHYGADGDFVIRDSETNAGDFSVSLKAPGRRTAISMMREKTGMRARDDACRPSISVLCVCRVRKLCLTLINSIESLLPLAGKNKHFRVRFVDGGFNIGQRRFASLDELVDHYKKAPIYTGDSGKVKLFLVKSFIMPPANSG